MPETAVNEDRNFPRWEDDVGAAGKITPMQSESQSSPVKIAADTQFRLCIPAADGGHISTALIGRDSVGHGSGV